MKAKKKVIILLAALMAISFAFTGCTALSNQNQTPQDIIKDAYGNTEFTISFIDNGAVSPIADITYTANNMPTLPTPEKLGYVFEGWYLDSAFTIPYSDGILYLYMRDVTLYAKWAEESLEQNGVYDVELSAEILAETVTMGEISPEEYIDFTECIVWEESWLEKTDGVLQLKLQYDCGTTVPFGFDDAIIVGVDQRSANDVYIRETIASDSETIKTIFIDINDIELDDSIYLRVYVTDWTTPGITNADRAKTTVSYVVELKIERFIGFTETFVDVSVPLVDGYYLVNTHYKQDTNEDTMMESYNPVYSYIIAENGRYTLVKQFMPYAGLIGVDGTILDPYTLNYYDRAMTFAPMQLYYYISAEEYGENKVEAEYLPNAYDAGYYGVFSMEFHADTGRYYAIYDLGDDLTTELMIAGAATGFMEVGMAMGQTDMIMTLDYEHIVRLASIDFTPLEGDAYSVGDEFAYYPGSNSDLSEHDLDYAAMENYGLSIDIANYYYTASSIDASIYSRTMYSHKITVTPTAATNADTVANSRYKIAEFTTNTKIYGYDGSSNLYADNMSVNSFGGYGRRNNVEILKGKSYDVGDRVALSDVYLELVDATGDFGSVSYTVYPIIDGVIDYDNPQSAYPQTFEYSSPVAVVFTSEQEYKRLDGTTASYSDTTIVRLVTYVEPVVNIINTEENVYDPDAEYVVGDTVYFPIVRYEWMGNSGSFIGNYYMDSNGDMGVDPLHVALCIYYDDGMRDISYVAAKNLTFTLATEQESVIYELTNPYGEKYYYLLEFNAKSVESATPRYELILNDAVFESGNISYNDAGEIIPLSLTRDIFMMHVDKLQLNDYVLVIDEKESKLSLVSYTVKTKNYIDADVSVVDGESAIQNIIAELGNDYAFITLVYSDGVNTITESILSNVTFGGASTTNIFNYNNYFSGYSYIIPERNIYSLDGEYIGYLASALSISTNLGERAYSIENIDGQNIVTFNYPGEYTITYFAALRYNVSGGYVFYDGTSVRMFASENVNVLDGVGTVTITYHTDEDHPFEGGFTTLDVVYSLTGNIVTPLKTAFESTPDLLFGWAVSEGYSFRDSNFEAGGAITDFIGTFNSAHVNLYALWDEGIYITVDMNKDVTGRDNMSYLYYLNTSSYRGYYTYTLSTFEVPVVNGWTFVGWTIDGEFVSSDQSTTLIRRTTGAITIKLEYKQQFSVRYIINQLYSSSYYLNDLILDGECISESRVPIGRDGYVFKEWQIVIYDESGSEIGFESFAIDTPVTENMVLRAVFTDAEGNEVW